MTRAALEIPNSWYLVAYSDEIAPGELRTVQILARDFVLFRGEAGTAHVMDAHCPHLGAHMGVGGRVVGDTLRCPFHGWRWNGDGSCAGIPYAARIPERARAVSRPVVERDGMILLWFHAEGAAPGFAIPGIPEWGNADWLDQWMRWEWTVRSHPQEIAENGIDWPHFRTIHRMEVPSDHGSEFLEHRFTWQVGGSKPVSSIEQSHDQIMMHGENWGLGYSWLRQHGHYETVVVTGLTPVDRETTRIRMGVIARIGANPDAATRAAFAAYMEEHAAFAAQDLSIWENKRYRARPALCDGDGPIAAYRRWAAQFYSSPASLAIEITR